VTFFKVLRPGRVAPFSGLVWPEPGAWVEADGLDPCRRGIHACRLRHLPHWLGPELWEIELDGELVQEGRKVAARRGRLVRRIEGWNEPTARAYVEACISEARTRAERSPELASYSPRPGPRAAVAGYIVARLAELQDGVEGYEAERRRQAQWLADELELEW
jgi:hypothetical protein